MPLRIALQMDPLARLDTKGDSTLELARAAVERGHRLFHYTPAAMQLRMADNRSSVLATGAELLYRPGETPAWRLDVPETRDLGDFDIILMRQDPPFDLAYITATHLLELLSDKVRIVNDPKGVRDAPEKLLIARFPQFLPPTLVTRDLDAIRAFRARQGEIVIKPLFGFAGHGIFHLRPDDDNLPALIESLSAATAEPWMIQQYLPVKALGDKRIVMLAGEPVGCFRRLPAKGDARSNLRVGGSAEAAPLTPHDRVICAALGPALRERGLFLCGVDVIGDYLTEINVTSPTGLLTVDRLEGRSGDDRIAEQFWRQLEQPIIG